MNDPLSPLRDRFRRRTSGSRQPGPEGDGDHPHGLQLLTAQLLLATGLGTAFEGMGRAARADADVRDDGGPARAAQSLALTWAPAVLGPLAAIAHAAVAFSPTERNRTAARVLDAAAIGGGLLAVSGALAAERGRTAAAAPSLSALSLASAGALGLLLDHSATEQAEERRRLERRASVVERLVPSRRSRVDRIVVHI